MDISLGAAAGKPSDWLVGGGETGDLIRALDWSDTPLGARHRWPLTLRTVVRLVVESQFPMALLWGRELILLYNDAYRFICADRHPRAMGRSTREIWPEVWHINEPIFAAVLERGQAIYLEDERFPIDRRGHREDAYFTLCYSPVRGEDGLVAGSLVTLLETTRRVEELRSSEAELRRERAFLRTVIDSISSMVMVRDAAGRCLLANEAAARFHGTTAQALEGLDCQQVGTIPPEALASDREAFATGNEGTGELDIVAADGQRHFVITSHMPLLNDEGVPDRVLETAIDITWRKRAEEERQRLIDELEVQQAKLETILDQIPAGIIIAEAPTGRLVYGNHRAHEMFGGGYHPSGDVNDYVNWHLHLADGSVCPPRDLPMARALRGEVINDEPLLFPQPGAGAGWLNLRVDAAPLREPGGSITGAIIAVQDVTARTKAEQALRESEERFRIMADGSPVIIWVTGPEGGLQFVNRTYREFFGATYEEVAGGQWQPLVHPDDAAAYVDAFREAIRTRTAFDAEARVRRADGEWRWVASHGEPRFSASGEFLGHAGISPDITERKRAELALRDSEARLRLALTAAKGGGYVFDLPSQTLHVSAEAARVYGLPEDTRVLSKADALDLILPEDRHSPEAALQQAIATNGVYRAEYRVRLPDGGVRALASFGQLQADTGRLVGLVMDVTERRASEETLRDREEQLRELLQVADRRTAELLAVIESMPDAVYMGTRDGITRCNTNALRMLGAKSLEDLQARIGELGTKFSVRWPDSGRLLRDDELQFTRALEGEAVTEEVLATNARTGEDLYIRSACAPVVYEGAVIGAVAINSDITDRKRAEEAIRMRERDLARAQAAAHLGNWSWDLRSDAVVWSEELYRIFGVDAKTFRPSNAAAQQLIHPEDRARHAELVGMALTGTAVAPFESRIVRPTGEERVVLASGFEVQFDALGEPATLFGTVLDITDRKRAEEALQEANVRLEEADRRKDEFIAVLSHELRNPLAPIRFALPLLERERLTEPAARAVAVINRQVDHLARLVDDLLDVSRITRGTIELQREYVTLGSILTAAIEAASPALASARHNLKMAIAEEPVWLYADAARLTQVVTNLLNNGAKFTPRGGEITLEADLVDGQAVIRVRDSGMGISADALPTIFEMFHQVHRPDPSQGGLGIGLALVKRLVEMHGGRIEADSPGLGLGAEFVVSLPVAKERNPVVISPSSMRGARAAHRLKVLIVDDNADLVEMLGTVVASLGHDVRKALDGQSAISAARSYRPDVVLLDLGLPVMSGIEVARELRHRPETAHVRLVAVTGWGQAEDRRQTGEAGFDHHLTKPTDPRVLEQLLETFARERAS